MQSPSTSSKPAPASSNPSFTIDCIPGYRALTQISESSTSLVYRARRETDDLAVVLKILKPDRATPKIMTRYKQEYEIARNFDLPGAVRALALQSYQNTPFIVFEDFGGISLKEVAKKQRFSLVEFLNLAIKIAEILSAIHAKNIIHKDINPSNIVVNLETDCVKIVDFGISTVLSRETPSIENASFPEGTLAYMSPEQTGRMNRSLDYRTDFYSLGATFYELLTQQKPFQASDVMEMVHCHIAKQPVRPDRVSPSVPKAIGDIVMKMLAKTPEDRYQSAWGIQADLVLCLMQLEANGEIEEIVPGENDISDKFKISERLYGRENELETLLLALDRVGRGGKEIVFVSGYSGIGKSSLVREIAQPTARIGGYFISEKCDPARRNAPFSALGRAFQPLARLLLTRSEAQLDLWREKLQAALGEDGGVVAEVVPEVELIVGPQLGRSPRSADISPKRSTAVFRKFVRVFCSEAHPLVIFLDDLQYADTFTLNLLESLVLDRETCYLLAIGAYRDREAEANNSFAKRLDLLRESGVAVGQIHLTPLRLEPVVALVADTLQCGRQEAKPLAELILRKTSGNPFFINQFLHNLYQERLLAFNMECLGWQWNVAQIESLDITDNVVELTIGKLKKLPEEAQQILRLAACMGDRFDLQTLSLLWGKSPMETFQGLWPAIYEELVQPISEMEASDGDAEREEDCAQLLVFRYKFLHDRLQQAAYTLSSPEKKQETHHRIGRIALERASEDEREENLFEIVRHLNLGRDCQETDRWELARLNLKAARKARRENDRALALHHLHVALEILEAGPVAASGSSFDLYAELAAVEYLCGCFDRSEERVRGILFADLPPRQQAELHALTVRIHTLRARYDEAIAAGREAIALLAPDAPVPTDPKILAASTRELLQELLQALARGVPEPSPAASSEDFDSLSHLLVSMEMAASATDTNLWRFVAAASAKRSWDKATGNARYALACYGALLATMENESSNPIPEGRRGFDLSEAALRQCERSGDRDAFCRVCFRHNATAVWMRSLPEVEELNQQGIEAGLRAENFRYAGYLHACQASIALHRGKPLDRVALETRAGLLFARETENQWAIALLSACEATVGELRGVEVGERTSDALDRPATRCYRAIFKARVLCLEEEYNRALQRLQEAEPLLPHLIGSIHLADYLFYQTIVLSGLYPRANPEERERYLECIAANCDRLKRWAKDCPETFAAKHAIAAARQAALLGQDIEALDLFDRAIELAAVWEFLQDEALAAELAAQFWLFRGKERLARPYLREAYATYQKWGARKKLEHLETKYGNLFVSTPTPLVPEAPSPFYQTQQTATTGTISTAYALDLATVLKASQAISGEIVFKRLLDKLMTIAIENAGAQSGCLILERDGKLWVEASGSVARDRQTVLQSTPVEACDRLPVSLIFYAARTQEDVAIDNAIESDYANDPYVRDRKPKSILCSPLLNQGKLIALLYLENNLTVGAFARDRLELLNVLCSQAAISLQNARLYQGLQESEAREREKAQQLQEYLQQLQEAQLQLVQSEKMSTLGQLVAGVAHEINNPVNFIAGNLRHAQEFIKDLLFVIHLYQEQYPEPAEEIEEEIEAIDLEFLARDLPELISAMKEGTDRIIQISRSLTTFSRRDSSEKTAFNIHDGIDSTLLILKYRLKENQYRPRIETIKAYGELPPLECFPGQLNQVFMNLLANAIDALDDSNEGKSYAAIAKNPNRITIRTGVVPAEGDRPARIRIAIVDNGPGMPEEVQQKIFNHLFTTKPVGKGTGLGLSISRKIVVDAHGGELFCKSEPGRGTEFTIEIPTRAVASEASE